MSNAADKSRKAMGKGLSALLPSRPAAAPAATAPSSAAAPIPAVQAGPTLVPIDQIEPNPLQPRTVFTQDRLEELAQSIRANGVIQPLIVRKHGAAYELIAGERRWRASRLAGLAEVPVVVQDFANDRLLEIALIENIQREDLNPIEAAHAFERLSREMGLSHEEIGRRTGKERSSIANMIRLLKLPAEVQRLVAENRLPMGQARALLALPEAAMQIELAEKACAQGMSTRQVEAVVRGMTEPRNPGAKPDEAVKQDPNVRAAADEMQRILGTRVRIVEQNGNRGKIEVEYYAQDDLMRVYAIIVREE